MIRAVIFDIDGTLYDYDAAHAVAYRALSEDACEAFSLTRERFDALHRDAMRVQKERAGMPCAAIHNRLIRYQILLEALGQPIGRAPRMERLYWNTLIDAAKPFPGVAETLRALRSRGLTVGIGTNMTADWQFRKLEALNLIDLVDFMVSSEEAGVEKPDRRLFELCAAKADCDAPECVFVGDSLKGDVLAAVNAGMCAVWFCPVESSSALPEGAARMRAYSELPDLLNSF